MKITKKITSIVLALLLAVSAFAGLAITASAVDVPAGPYTLNITKYQIPETATNHDTFIGPKDGLSGTSYDDPNLADDVNYAPLNGVTFTMYKVAGLNETKTLEEAKALFDAATSGKISGTTGEGGEAGKVTLSTDVAGLYYVEETAKPASVTSQSAPFLVYLPMTDQYSDENNAASHHEGEQWNTDVYVYPKNLTTLAGTKLEKTVNGVAYDASKVATAPVFKLYAGIDATGTPIATFTLGNSTNATPTAVKETNANEYETVNVGVKGGVMVVDGLPTKNNGTTADYCWIEVSGVTLVGEDTPLPFVTTPKTFTVVKNASSTIEYDSSQANFGEYTYGAVFAHDFKLDNASTPTITKTVDKATAGIGEVVTWTVQPSVPTDIDKYTKYTVTDILPAGLAFVEPNAISMTVGGASYTGVTPSISGDTAVIDFSTHISDLYTKDDATGVVTAKPILITIKTVVTADAPVNTTMTNTATIDFENPVKTDSATATADTITGGFSIIKKANSDNGTAMADVEFILQTANGENVKVNAVADQAGYYTADVSQEAVTDDNAKVVTNADGKIFVKGLAQGTTYKLIETKTNDGYQLLTSAKEVPITATTYSANGDITIVNVKQPDLPLTGGMGTILFSVAGIALIGGAAFFFIRSRKSRKEEI